MNSWLIHAERHSALKKSLEFSFQHYSFGYEHKQELMIQTDIFVIEYKLHGQQKFIHHSCKTDAQSRRVAVGKLRRRISADPQTWEASVEGRVETSCRALRGNGGEMARGRCPGMGGSLRPSSPRWNWTL